MVNCSVAAKQQVLACKNSVETLEKLTATQKQTTLSAKAASMGLKALSVAGNMLANIGLTFVASKAISFIYDMVTANTRLLQNAKELTSEFKNTESSINDYKQKISELHTIINDSSSSIADTAKARQDLMAIQDELIKKFGTEKDTVNIITDAINNQSDALDELSKKQYIQWKNDFNDKDFGQSVGDFLASDNISNSFAKLTEFDFSGAWDMLTQPTTDNITTMVNSMKYAYYELEKTGNETLDDLIKKSYGLTETFDGKFVLKGNLSNIHEDLLSIQELSTEFEISDRFESEIARISNAANKTLESYKNAYDTYVLYEKVLDNSKDNQYDEQFDAINKAKEAYDKAFSSGDDSAIQKASEDYANVLSGAMNLATENYDEDVAEYFRNMYPELQEIVSAWEFSADFKLNTDGIVGQTTDASSKFNSTEEILNFNAATATQEQIDAYGTLNNVAGQYNMTLLQMIGLLEKEGVIQSENRRQLEDKFGKTNVSSLSDEDLKIAYEVSDGTIQSWDELIAKIEEYKAKLKEGDKQPTSFNPESFKESLSSLSSLQSLYADFKENANEGIDFTFDYSDVEDLREKFGDTCESFEDFVKLATTAGTSADDMQNAFDRLVNEYVVGSGILDGLNSSTREQIISQLELQGVENASQIITEELAVAKEYAANAGIDLSNATADEITEFFNEANASGVAGSALAQLELSKRIVNGTMINTSGDIDNVIALANAAGASAEVLANLARAKAALESGGTSSMTEWAEGYINKVNSGNVDFGFNLDANQFKAGTGSGNKSKSGGGSASEKDTWKEAYQKELAELEHFHNMGIISDKDFYKLLNALNEKYFNDSAEHHEKYLDEYQSNQEKIYKGLKDLYKDLLNQQKDYADSAVSAVTERLDDEISGLEKLKDAAEESYQKQIDAIDKKIDALEKERDARKKAIQDQLDAIEATEKEKDLQEALADAIYEKHKAENQKSRTYQSVDENGGQVVYKSDSKAISNANDAIDDARNEIKKNELEKQLDDIDRIYDEKIEALEAKQDRLKEKMDAVTASYESQIDSLTSYKEQWSSVADEYQTIQDRQAAAALLGADWEAQVLSGRMDTLSLFRDNYLRLNEEIANADTAFGLDATTAVENYATSINEMLTRTTALEDVLQSWQDLNIGLSSIIGVGGGGSTGENSTSTSATKSGESNSKSSQGEQKSGSTDANTIVGAVSSGGLEMETALTTQWIPAWQNVGNNMNEICSGIVSCVNEMSTKVVESCTKAIEAINMANAAKNSTSSSNPTPAKFEGTAYVGQAFARGTNSISKDQTALLNELGEEGIIRDGKLIKVTGGMQYVDLKRDDMIVNHAQMDQLEKGRKVTANGGRASLLNSYAAGTDELVTVTPDSFAHLQKLIGETFVPNINIPKYNTNDFVMRQQESVVHQDINVTLPNITNETGFKNFEKELETMKLNALQRSYKR